MPMAEGRSIDHAFADRRVTDGVARSRTPGVARSRVLALGTSLAAGLALLLLGPCAAPAQEGPPGEEGREAAPDSARVVGQVVSDLTGEPISGAAVSMRGSRAEDMSDSTGHFALPPTEAGTDTLDVRYLGYESGFIELHLQPDRTTRLVLLLSPEAVQLAELEVVVSPSRSPGDAMTEGFRRRRNRGMGTFFDRQEIERRNPRYTSDLLRSVRGIRVGPQRMGRTSVTLARSGRACRPEIFVDGLHLQGASVDDVIVPDLEGVEVYPGPSLVPARFSAMAPTQCGAIIIWTRRGESPGRR
jgi:hypothetical protein